MLYQKNNYNLDFLSKNSQKILNCFKNKKILLLYGDLGAGKTQLVKILGRDIGIKQNIFSPTFLISKYYDFGKNKKLYHYDFYRLSSIDDLNEIGFMDVLTDENSIIAIEWPDKIPDFKNFLFKHIDKDQISEIYLSHTDDPDLRSIKIKS